MKKEKPESSDSRARDKLSQGLKRDPLAERVRKLLLHKREIRRLMGKTQERGYTLVPLKIYLKNGKIKVELGLAKGKTLYDKRETLKKRSADREIEKVMKEAKGRR